MNLCQNVFHEHTCLSNTQALSYFFKLISLHDSFAELQPHTSIQHVTKAKLYIENNFNKNITVRDVAREIFVNERYLYNLFMKYEKISIKDYINLQRYSHARELLSNTNLAISDIAQSVGYHDVFAFSKFFAKQAGLSPTKYRESIIHPINN
jgi:two-component system response regulator YesN